MTATQSPVPGLTTRPGTGTSGHGGTALALGKRCPCDECRKAKNAYQRRVYRLKGYGRWQPLIDAATTREHVQALHAAGASYTQIAERCAMAELTVRRIARGKTQMVRPETETTILALPVGAVQRKLLPSAGSVRRLQALVAVGWPLTSLGPRIGVNPDSVARMLRQPYMYPETADAIAAAYDRLKDADPQTHGVSLIGVSKSRALAVRRRWPDPVWWEDMGHIDDPAFDPDAADRELSRNEQAALRREEVEHLMSFDYPSETIADRLGMHVSTVRAIVLELRSGRRRNRQGVVS